MNLRLNHKSKIIDILNKISKFFNKNILYFEGFALFIIMSLLFSREFDYILPNIFNLRDYLRIDEILKGHHIFFGPELSKNGNIPGPFYYYFIFIPYYLAGYKGVAFFMYLCLGATFGLLWIFLDKIKISHAFFIVSIIFLISPTHKDLREMVWNPSFLPLFWLILIMLLYFFFRCESEIKSQWYLFSFLSALSIQLHMSSIALCILGHALYIYYKKNWDTWWKGFLIFMLPFIPYFLWIIFLKPKDDLPAMFDAKFDISSLFIFLSFKSYDFFQVKKILTSVIYFFRPIFLITVTALFLLRFITLTRKKLVKEIYFDLFIFLIFTCIMIFILPVLISRENTRYLLLPIYLGLGYVIYAMKELQNERVVLNIIFSIFLFLLLVYFYLNSHFFKWNHVVEDKTFWILLAGTIFSSWIISRRLKFVCSTSILFLTFFIILPIWNHHTEKSRKLVPLHIMNSLTEKIYNETNWSPEEFNKRIMWRGVLPEISMQYIYLDYYSKHSAKQATSLHQSLISGYIISHSRLDSINNYQNKSFIDQYKNNIFSKSKIADFEILSYSSDNQVNELPLYIQNTGQPLSELQQYTQKLKNVHSVQTFEGKGPLIYFSYDNVKNELVIYSKQTSYFFTLGSNMYIDNAEFTFLCDMKKNIIRMPNLGTSVGKTESDIFEGFNNSTSFLKGTIYTPLYYGINCKDFLPIKFSVKEIRLFTWGKDFKLNLSQQNFLHLF